LTYINSYDIIKENIGVDKMSKGIQSSTWRTDIDNELIVKLYTVDKLNIYTICQQTGYDHGVIERHLTANGIKIEKRPRSDKAKDNTPAKNKLFYKYRMQAKRRNIEFKLKQKDFLQIIEQKCFYCGAEHSNTEITPSGHILLYNGIDRLDNTRGYELDNVVPCCKICNHMKSDLPYDVFKEQIKKVYEYHREV